ncbi:hypothetical protein IAQ61_008834 [Plenodomus lingam]|uniref:Uncharacterized protein n=1 Tax=Leptosphaeria maculans (strain JN3 / isolate v23.1.3 / race Av1-4-5-6-7-8) TaxID=985895 RepID=E4ZP87_LEPMJ|nr:hypothetical protein LEMA_P040130.1 [Plenodomus lingam JN3]KAH9864889.1 hypothetical protein IAQ61_008834 [Plenodomus lingam]CBX93112.1 hypothetical protein LEMA_P040130.1 [Plenodomus lingam JN3]
MEKIKEKLHIGSSKKNTETDTLGGSQSDHVGTIEDNRDSIDSELAAMPPHERVAYLKEFEDSDKHDIPKKGGLLERLIARGNKRTEEQIERESREDEARRQAHRDATHAQIGPGTGASAHSVAGPGGL